MMAQFHCLTRLHRVHCCRVAAASAVPSASDRRITLSHFRTNNTDADTLLESLQSNAAALRRRRWQRHVQPEQQLLQTAWCLRRLGVDVRQLRRLRAVHVAGSKGKGSTCALLEALMRAHGLRTGFYSSPHLVTPRERVRIDGRPLSSGEFDECVRHVYDTLRAACDATATRPPMPMYFAFLTVLAYYVFVRRRVDVAVIETGIGGRFDCTNVLRRPAVCGVTALHVEHADVLGGDIGRIAWQKAGIMKPHVPVVVAPQRHELAARVLAACAAHTGARWLRQSPPLTTYGGGGVRVSLAGAWQHDNASLALQLWRTWRQLNPESQSQPSLPEAEHTPDLATSAAGALDKCGDESDDDGYTSRLCDDSVLQAVLPTHVDGDAASSIELAAPFSLTALEQRALATCHWPGRCQVIERRVDGAAATTVRYCLDGAHTAESIRQAAGWFDDVCDGRMRPHLGAGSRVLVVYLSGGRDAASLLQPLTCDRSWTHVLFCTPHVFCRSGDADCRHVDQRLAVADCRHQMAVWQRLTATSAPSNAAAGPLVAVKRCVTDAVQFIERRVAVAPAAGSVCVFVVGSLHLVGGFLSVIDAELGSQPGRSSSDKNGEAGRRHSEVVVQ